MADGTGDPVSAAAEYILIADRFDQIVERRPDRSPLRVIKHRRGDIVTGLTDAETERLLLANAIAPYVEPVLDGDHGDEDDADDEDGTDSPDSTGDTDGDQGDDSTPDDAGEATSVEKPSRTGLVADWRAYAVTKGLTEAEAADMTRAELIARFGD
ncbi:hypothetical protein [Nocardia sp. NPDC058633]|uniref:hypothetical protein n=1 Tax=Nocardia sp. NPDC058633 TaxID=3346568 RepID=UPI003657EAF2